MSNDFVSILVPGAAFPGAQGLALPQALQFYKAPLWIVFLISYIIGRFIQAISKFILEKIVKISDTDNLSFCAFQEIQAEIKKALTQYYKREFSQETLEKHMKDLCYSPVWERMDNYRLFVALSSLFQSFTLILVIMGLEFLAAAYKGTFIPFIPFHPIILMLISAE